MALGGSEGDRHSQSIFDDASRRKQYQEKEKKNGLYYKFANYFVDDKANLVDIMQ